MVLEIERFGEVEESGRVWCAGSVSVGVVLAHGGADGGTLSPLCVSASEHSAARSVMGMLPGPPTDHVRRCVFHTAGVVRLNSCPVSSTFSLPLLFNQLSFFSSLTSSSRFADFGFDTPDGRFVSRLPISHYLGSVVL